MSATISETAIAAWLGAPPDDVQVDRDLLEAVEQLAEAHARGLRALGACQIALEKSIRFADEAAQAREASIAWFACAESALQAIACMVDARRAVLDHRDDEIVRQIDAREKRMAGAQ